MKIEEDFPCNACGLCCRLVGTNPQTAFLDRGDGICQHLDVQSNLCTIYSERPLICRVKDYYKAYLTKQLTWQEFIKINSDICKKLQDNDPNK
ncbi:YkgJ family cysteine cluster protein [Rappaport israeli]|uniref:YkgJ family cysteine cluster protein n=1 Tax=Rappaport israeli TaxID=1839807 RepID=UPI00098FF5AB|nr:YkgJ family cysteine cluster protein [Rappaport israeli]